MNEKENMLLGQIYNAQDKQLLKERKRAKELCFKFNNTNPSNYKRRTNIIKRIVGSVGANCWIEQSFWCDYGYNIHIGDNFYSNHNLTILDVNKVIIGNNVLIGPNCSIYCATHPIEPNRRLRQEEYGRPITIGDNVWIGGNTVILPGVTIGKNSVIGSGSVVTKDIPDNVVAVGNPCKVIKNISDKKEE